MADKGCFSRDRYTVGWLCALPVEFAAAKVMLDEVHEDCIAEPETDSTYQLGRIGEHNIVIACLPESQIGTSSAAAVANWMKLTFTSIRVRLMVGIGGGVPSTAADIRLGDVVISRPENSYGGVVQHDFGKLTSSGFRRTGFLNAPPKILLNAVASLKVKHMLGDQQFPEFISKFNCLPEFRRKNAGRDVLFDSNYDHAEGATCSGSCDKERIIHRKQRRQRNKNLHYGNIASGNQVIKSAAERDRISSELGGVLCFEMEAAGLMNEFPCLVIRGICDYSDSHKNKRWQPYAAAAAAARAKELLSVIPRAQQHEPKLSILWPSPSNSVPYQQGYRNLTGELALFQRLKADYEVEISNLVSRWLLDDSSPRCLLILDKADIEAMSFPITKPYISSSEPEKNTQAARMPYGSPKITELVTPEPRCSMPARNHPNTQQLKSTNQTKVEREDNSPAPTKMIKTETTLKIPSKHQTPSNNQSASMPTASRTTNKPTIRTSQHPMVTRSRSAQ
ncbi:hypothetical protein N7493_007725 [Penicillium malachiteum]|uniref:Nucleoside phosphorylase domain-containing protein n=1 Tax=Penicillium malachiteum TaxID=1324776 RepID=A0AAD6HIA1_9EURO|nr:hypothetical protein N7493_007725 [Penicillium malachiteum]